MASGKVAWWRMVATVAGLGVAAAVVGLLARPPERGAAARPDYAPVVERVQEFIKGRPQHIGVYFRDLASGEEWGVDADAPIPAASTVKVPIALYVNELVAEGRLKWSDRVTYRESEDKTGGAGVLQYDGKDGNGYSLRVLTNLLITISDNVAWRMLTRHLGKDNIAAFMRRLGGRTVFPGGQNVSTARDMGTYLAAVLEFNRRHPQLGERLLDDMAHSIWHVGLPGQLPADVRVAHKEGDITGVADDVGIIYGPRPYLLAVMSEGVSDIDQGFADIARLSRIVWEFQSRLPAATPQGL